MPLPVAGLCACRGSGVRESVPLADVLQVLTGGAAELGGDDDPEVLVVHLHLVVVHLLTLVDLAEGQVWPLLSQFFLFLFGEK